MERTRSGRILILIDRTRNIKDLLMIPPWAGKIEGRVDK